MDDQGRRDAGMKVRREVLGDAHVDRATAATTDFTREFQQLITEYAWGTIWTRPGLDRREVESLAKTMEVKFTVSGPAIGGAKSGIDFDIKSCICNIYGGRLSC